MMESWNIKGRTLEYLDQSHIYICDGVKVPSVTQLLNRKFGNKYDGISKEVLMKAAERGTQIHKAIECYCKGFDDGSSEVRDFKFLQKHYGFETVENELPIILTFGGETYAGRLDLILKIDGKYAVADIKTTATLDKEYLGHQLNLYRMGVEQSYDYKIESLYGVHLRDGKRKLAKIPIKEEEWLLQSLMLKEPQTDTE